jgi:hypothetical protein
MRYISYILLFVISFSNCPLCALSVIYNLRISQVTGEPIDENNYGNSSRVLALFFDNYQAKYVGDIKQNAVGVLTSFIHDFSSEFYLRTDFAVGHITEHIDHVATFSDTETDDILLTFGRHFIPHETTKLTISGLFGIPTHSIFALQHVDFGYGQLGVGAQLDGIYHLHYLHDTLYNTDFVYGLRYLYFVPGHAFDHQLNRYVFTIGNLFDILMSVKKKWGHHGIEGGYTRRWDFGAHIMPTIDDIVEKTNYTRNNFYFVYKYQFQIREIHNRLLFNIAYGFDSRPKDFGNKHIVFFWTSWVVHF